MAEKERLLLVTAVEDIKKEDYVIVSAQGAKRVTASPGPPGSHLARALEDIPAGRHGNVRDLSRRGR